MGNNFFKTIYEKLVKSDDTPHHVALGFAIGIFYGLFPFVGVIFTIVTAFIFRANKISALIGCFVTNTWMSAVLILPSLKLGSKILGLDWRQVWQASGSGNVLKAFSGDILIPSLLGFILIALGIAFLGYVISLFFIIKYKKRRKYAEDIRP